MFPIPNPFFTIMSLKIYINGKLYDKEDAKISVYDHGLLYGDGVFEGIRSYAGKVFRMAEHLERLWDSAKAIWLKIPHLETGDGQGDRGHAGRQRHSGRLHPRGGHPGRRHAGPGPQPLQPSASDHHRRQDRALSARVVRARDSRSLR